MAAPTIVEAPNLELVRGISVSSAGGTVELMSDPWLVTSAKGITGPKATLELDELPDIDGSFVRGGGTDHAGISLAAVTPTFGLSCDAGTPAATAADVRRLRTILGVRRYGPATLRITLLDGSSRTLGVLHAPGEDDFEPPAHGGSHWQPVLRLTAPRPLWAGTEAMSPTWAVAGSAGGEVGAGGEVPWGLAPDAVDGAALTFPIDGDEVTPPILHVRGAVSAVTLTRSDGAGYTLTPTSPLTSGQLALVKHDPQAILSGPQVVAPDGSSGGRWLSDGADLFDLRPGTETVTLSATGVGSGFAAWLTWTPLYWSALT